MNYNLQTTQWAIPIRVDKNIRLRLPAFILVELYKIKENTTLNISEILRIMIQEMLKNPNLPQIMENYAKLKRSKRSKRQKQTQTRTQTWEEWERV
jgi:antitoxin component of RelBE/YafQ-DinJ toxin-antitoxin module